MRYEQFCFFCPCLSKSRKYSGSKVVYEVCVVNGEEFNLDNGIHPKCPIAAYLRRALKLVEVGDTANNTTKVETITPDCSKCAIKCPEEAIGLNFAPCSSFKPA